MDFVFFAQIYSTVTGMISDFAYTLMVNVMGWVSAISLILFTIWITIQGYRVLTGQSRDSMLVVVLNLSRTAFILIIASTLAFVGGNLQHFVNNQALVAVNCLVTSGTVGDACSGSTVQETIDKNLIYTQVAMALIEAEQGLNSTTSAANVAEVGRTTLMAVVGLAGPPMTAAALLLTYQIALALFIGLGPLFIMCLIFDRTKNLFHGWLMYGIGTMFSMAVLSVVVAIVLKITLAVAAALWTAGAITTMLGVPGAGLNNQAMQQGGIGILMTALIIGAPTMAGKFFGATLSEFRGRSEFDGLRREHGGHPAHAAQTPSVSEASNARQASNANSSTEGVPTRNNSLPPSSSSSKRVADEIDRGAVRT
jgi:type IV secretion system protein VirB6